MTRFNYARMEFTDYDFIRLFIAMIKIKNENSIDRDELRYQLIQFYNVEEYKVLFQDITVRKQIEGDYVDIYRALQEATFYGLINQHDSQPIGNKRIILIDDKYSKNIIEEYDVNYSFRMDSLTDQYIKNKKCKIKEITK